MQNLLFESIPVEAVNRIRPFFEAILGGCPEKVQSLHVTGSAVTSDFSEKTSDINSLILLDEIHFMTPSYIDESLDVFPMEFLELKLIHKTAYGNDIVKDLEIDPKLLRLQCEREIKTRLIGLWQGYISSFGETDIIASLLWRSIKGCMPLFRSIILMGKDPPLNKIDVINSLNSTTHVDKEVLIKALLLKEKRFKDREEVLSLFESYYGNLETVAGIVNAL